MGGAILHSEAEVSESSNELVWIDSLPFQACPKELIDQLEEHPFTYERYLSWCEWMNKQEMVWNTALIYQGKYVIAFAWGVWEPIDETLRVSHLTTLKRLFKADNTFLLSFYYELMKMKSSRGLKRVYWEAKRWRAYARKCGKRANLMPVRLLEVMP